ncbi:MAG: MFS transporter [Elusimicrobiota bacterium]
MKYSFKFWTIVIVEGLMVGKYAISFPFLALYMTQKKGFDMSVMGGYFSIVMLISSLSSTFGGSLSDYIGRRNVMFFSLLTRAVFIFLISFSIYLNLNPLWILIFNFLASVGGLGFHSVALAYISDVVSESERVKSYSILRVSTNAGWAIGPAVGGFIANTSYPLAFLVSAIVFFVAAFFVFFFAKDVALKRSDSALTLIKDGFGFKPIFGKRISREFKIILFYSFLMTGVMSQLVVPLSLYSKKYLGFSEKDIGFLFTLNGSIVILIQYFIGKMIKEEKIIKALSLSCLFYAAGYLLFGYSRLYIMAMFSIFIMTIGEVIFSPSLSTLVSRVSPENKRGNYIGIHSMISDFGRAFGVFAGTFLIDNFSYYIREISWWFVAVVSIISSYGFSTLKKYGKKSNESLDKSIKLSYPSSPV